MSFAFKISGEHDNAVTVHITQIEDSGGILKCNVSAVHGPFSASMSGEVGPGELDQFRLLLYRMLEFDPKVREAELVAYDRSLIIRVTMHKTGKALVLVHLRGSYDGDAEMEIRIHSDQTYLQETLRELTRLEL